MNGINSEERFKQLILFEGMERHRNIRPTDIDGFIDYNGVAFIYIEAKSWYNELDTGQRRALENVVNSHIKAGHEACAVVVRHKEPPENSVYLAGCEVCEYYTKGNAWVKPPKYMTTLDFVQSFERHCSKLKINI